MGKEDYLPTANEHYGKNSNLLGAPVLKSNILLSWTQQGTKYRILAPGSAVNVYLYI